MPRSNDPHRAHGAGTQTIARAAHVLRLIAARNSTGTRLVDLARHAKLERPTAHRILQGLAVEGLVRQEDSSKRWFLGRLVFELGLAASSQFNVRDVCRPVLVRLAERTGDTVFLTVRSGFDSVCVDRMEGSFPIKTLTLEVGTRRPLGVGAGGLALLMALPDQAVQDIVAANVLRLPAYNHLTAPAVLKLVKRCKKIGYALNDAHITPGASSLGLPIRVRNGEPFLAISIGAISSRMTDERQRELVSLIRAETTALEPALDASAWP
ncbi:MAG: IclR family transcriptional regulator [Gammaproteobacteria bacterium]|nr:IclR family transcriptional regulator [Gammaproteobacteria bacterium]MBI5615305.1 IclR family transcriptional regulator [Gammaproteobacteria bacterium]